MIKLHLRIGILCLTGLSLTANFMPNSSNWLSSKFAAPLTAQAQSVNSIVETEATLPQIQAWNGTTWGMSVQQVKELFENDLVEKKYRRCSASIRHLCRSYGLDDYTIGNQNYHVEFTFIANQLSEINFSVSETNSHYQNLESGLNNIQHWLTRQYGSHHQSSSQPNSYGNEISQQWHLAEKQVNLSYQTAQNSQINHLSVSLTPHFDQFDIQLQSVE